MQHLQHSEILPSIKKESWRIKQVQKSPISTYKIFSALEKPKDWNAIAEKCSNNPNHEHYGKTAEEILTLWQHKSSKGANRGNVLDDAITFTCQTNEKYDFTTIDADDITQQKYNQFLVFYNTYLKQNFAYIGSEIWLNSEKLNVICRLDSLFQYIKTSSLIVFDWKNTEKISYGNRWEKLQGPMSKYDNCEAVKYTLQTYIYKYILEEYGFDAVSTRVLQVLSNAYIIHKPAFEYSKQLIEEIVAYAHEQLKNS